MDDDVEVDFSLCEEKHLRDGRYNIVFTHPETLISKKYGRGLLQGKIYLENAVTIVGEEAHSIVEWLVCEHSTKPNWIRARQSLAKPL